MTMMSHHDDLWDPGPDHGPVWHAVMSLLTIAGIGLVALLVAFLAVPR